MVGAPRQLRFAAGGLLGFVALLGAISVLLSHAQVNAGEVGVVSHWGAIDPKDQPLQPGWHWILPFSGVDVHNVSIQQQNHSFKEVSTASRELQNVFVDGGINYHITSAEAVGITVNGGVEAYVNRIFNPAFQDYIKEVVPQYTTTEILANRAKIRDAVLQKLREKANDPNVTYHLTVDDLFLTDIHFDASYTKAIEAKQVSQQQLEQAKIDAQKAAAVAQGTADAAVVKAQGDAKAIILDATARAEANRLVVSNLTPELIAYLNANKWNGVLPLYQGTGTPLITLNPPAK